MASLHQLVQNCSRHILRKCLTPTAPAPLVAARTMAGQAGGEPPRVEKTVNTVTLLGRVGVEPQKRGSDAHPVVTFSMATHNNYRYENGDWSQRTDWHRIVIFKPALRDAVMSYLRKGQRTLVTGKITYGEITDQEGKTRLTTSIIADDVVFLQGAERGQQ